jgi:hypothetical protein
MDYSAAKAKKLLSSRHWRLRNLYHIRNEYGQRVLFRPYATQQRLFDKVARKNLVLKGRQTRVTTAYCLLWLDLALWSPDVKIGIVAHTKGEAAKIFREKIAFPYEQLPAAVRAANPVAKKTESEIVFANGSEISVGVSYRSGTLQVLHITEYGYTCARQPARAQEIKTGAMTAAQKGIIVVESTAMGRAGHFHDLCQEAQKGQGEWSFHFLPWYEEPTYTADTAIAEQRDAEAAYLDRLEAARGGAFSRGQRAWYCLKKRELGDDVYAEFPSTPEEAFRQSTEGAYYGSLLLRAWQEGRVSRIPIERALPVETWWDLGMRDSTTIWFVQRNGYELRLVDYYENSGEGLPHYAGVLDEWRRQHGAIFRRHVAPHDIKVRELNTGRTRLETAAELGVQFEVAPALPLADGIEAVRAALPRCVFDEERCAEGIRALEHYRKEWNEALSVYRNQPLHDWASHGADAFRTGITAETQGIALAAPGRAVARVVERRRWR